MNEMKFEVKIHAPRGRVWNTLWQDETLRDWAGIIDPGTYMDGDLKEGSEVQFISGNGYGVTSLVDKLTANEFLLLKHQADTQGSGTQERKKEWTGGLESYSLAENDDVTTLIVAFDVPSEQEEYFRATYPKALARVKELAENDKS